MPLAARATHRIKVMLVFGCLLDKGFAGVGLDPSSAKQSTYRFHYRRADAAEDGRFFSVIEKRVKHRNSEKRQEQAHRLTTDNEDPDRAVGRRARAATDDQRDDTRDKSDSRHENRRHSIEVRL